MKQWVYRIIAIISLLTLFSGIGQMMMPGFMLGLIGAEVTPTSAHFFGIIGMFMALFGGMLLHALVSARHHPIVVLWAGLQKLGAFAAVSLGVANDIFSALALSVAIFDLLSGLLILWYLFMIRNDEGMRQTQLI